MENKTRKPLKLVQIVLIEVLKVIWTFLEKLITLAGYILWLGLPPFVVMMTVKDEVNTYHAHYEGDTVFVQILNEVTRGNALIEDNAMALGAGIITSVFVLGALICYRTRKNR